MTVLLYRPSLDFTSGAGQLMHMQLRALRAAGVRAEIGCERGALRFLLRSGTAARRLPRGCSARGPAGPLARGSRALRSERGARVRAQRRDRGERAFAARRLGCGQRRGARLLRGARAGDAGGRELAAREGRAREALRARARAHRRSLPGLSFGALHAAARRGAARQGARARSASPGMRRSSASSRRAISRSAGSTSFSRRRSASPPPGPTCVFSSSARRSYRLTPASTRSSRAAGSRTGRSGAIPSSGSRRSICFSIPLDSKSSGWSCPKRKRSGCPSSPRASSARPSACRPRTSAGSASAPTRRSSRERTLELLADDARARRARALRASRTRARYDDRAYTSATVATIADQNAPLRTAAQVDADAREIVEVVGPAALRIGRQAGCRARACRRAAGRSKDPSRGRAP